MRDRSAAHSAHVAVSGTNIPPAFTVQHGNRERVVYAVLARKRLNSAGLFGTNG